MLVASERVARGLAKVRENGQWTYFNGPLCECECHEADMRRGEESPGKERKGKERHEGKGRDGTLADTLATGRYTGPRQQARIIKGPVQYIQ